MDEKLKWALSVIAGAGATFFKQYHIMIILVVMVICFDTITGLVKAKATGQGLNSKKGTQGFFKKISLLVALFFGFFLDFALPYFLTQINIGVDFNMPFGLIICFYIVINEAISITENLYATNPSVMPKWVGKLLNKAKDEIDNSVEIEEETDEQTETEVDADEDINEE